MRTRVYGGVAGKRGMLISRPYADFCSMALGKDLRFTYNETIHLFKEILMLSLKNVFLLSGAVLLAASFSYGQFGVKAGIGLGGIHGDSYVEDAIDGYIPCPMVGFTYHLTFGPFGVKPEVMFVRKGGSGSDYTLSAWYVDAPILASFSFIPTLSLIAGPSFGYFITGSETVDGESYDIEDAAPLNIGAVVGLQFMLPIAGLGVDVRYQRGFTTMDDNGDFDMMSDNMAITATYLF
ncbi:MAG TPA: outer membrane beta-barrel protein [Fibrobacteraceae bacterium]|nr:outer membrane beta-barrel protein [Fibrobacteraceae bacterium]